MTNEQDAVVEGGGESDEAASGANRPPKRASIPPQLRKKRVRDRFAPMLRTSTRSRAAERSHTSRLLEEGAPEDAVDGDGYVRRTNALFAATTFRGRRWHPANLEKAILDDGRLTPHAELVVFGEWLLMQNKPGFLQRGGRQFDPRLILRTLAAALAELRRRRAGATAAGPEAGTAKTALTVRDTMLDRPRRHRRP